MASLRKSSDFLTDQLNQDPRTDIKNLQAWIGAGRWAEPFEQAKFKRTPGTCEWIHEDAAFQIWQSQCCNPDATPEERLLSIQGSCPKGSGSRGE